MVAESKVNERTNEVGNMAQKVAVEKLDGTNYLEWKMVMVSHLKAQDLFKFCVRPQNRVSETDRQKDDQAKWIILSSLERSEIRKTGICETARDLWLKLQENYLGVEDDLKEGATNLFLSFSSNSKENLLELCGRYEEILGRLDSTGVEIPDGQKITILQRALTKTYKDYTEMWRMANPLGSVSKLISALKMKYHREILEKEEQPQQVFVAQESYKRNKKGFNSWKNKAKPSLNTSTKITCYACGK